MKTAPLSVFVHAVLLAFHYLRPHVIKSLLQAFWDGEVHFSHREGEEEADGRRGRELKRWRVRGETGE